MRSGSSHETVIDEWLEAQQRLSAVERFSRWHTGREAEPAETVYRDRIPLSAPGPGEQYAFHVDLDACTGCKACVAACHSLNGLDSGETWRSVDLLVGERSGEAVQQHVSTSCHHCVEPGCLTGCPVEAYEKDPLTGIVRHLDDQCIGCRYCTLKCPYGAPKYNARLGIVRKCDMCHGRLAAGEAPACVQGCPNGAIRIAVVDRSEVAARGAASDFLPAAPDPIHTRPATTWERRRPLPPGAKPADFAEARPGEAHTPLAVMLVLTQLSVGGFLVGRLVEAAGGGVFAPVRGVHTATSLALGLLALAASTLHLGRPLQAWRAILGVRTSWLSREILCFALFAGLASAYAALGSWVPEAAGSLPVRWLGAAVVASGLGGVACSALLYHDTRRELWRLDRTVLRFGLSTLVLGLVTTLFAGAVATVLSPDLSVRQFLSEWGRLLFALVAVVSLVKLGCEALLLRRLGDPEPSTLRRSAALLTGVLQQTTVARFATGVFGGILLPTFFFLVAEQSSPRLVLLAIHLSFGFVLGAELLERHLFFRASVAPAARGGAA